MLVARSILLAFLLITLDGNLNAQVKPAVSQDSLNLKSNDFDGDGVVDTVDKCINEKGPASNFGCPVIDPSMIHVDYPGLRNVYFAVGSSTLSHKAIEALKPSIQMLKDFPELSVNLGGHTDNQGNKELNRKLSMLRIKVVKAYLVSAGIDKNHITYSVYGSKYPIDDNRTREGRAKNRRVELSLYKDSVVK